MVLDDESDQAKVAQLYEQLICQDEVDLIIGPVRDAEHPVGDGGRRAARLRDAAAHRGAGAADDVRLPVPGLVDRPRAEQVRPEPAVRRGRHAAGRRRRRSPSLTNQNGSTDFVTYGCRTTTRPARVPSPRNAGSRSSPTSATRRRTTDWAADRHPGPRRRSPTSSSTTASASTPST